MFGRVEIIIKDKDNVLLLPREALIKADGKEIVYIEEEVARKREVGLGMEGERFFEAIFGVRR